MRRPGELCSEGPAKLLGVPYGARARMILLYLQTQAVRTGSREVELGRSLHDWLGRMGLSWGGETGKALKEQAARIAACSLKFFWEGEDTSRWEAGRFVRSGLRFHRRGNDDRQSDMWEDRVVLDESFHEALRNHPVPLREAALRELADRSTSLDLYVWLAYRLHNITGPTPIRWAALKDQFGSSYSEIRFFRRDFPKMLGPAVAAYPGAHVELADEGVILHPSPPPVATKVVAVGAINPPARIGRGKSGG